MRAPRAPCATLANSPQASPALRDSVDSRKTAMRNRDVPDDVNAITGEIVDAAVAVHQVFGPGLLERVYSACLAAELRRRRLPVEREISFELEWLGERQGDAFRIDIRVGAVIVEVKAVETVHPVHRAQVWTYMKLTGAKVGLILNFNTVLMRDGIVRVVQ